MKASGDHIGTVMSAFLLPFGSFILHRRRTRQQHDIHLSTPFWEFLVCVLFEIFLSFSLKVFMKIIRTFIETSKHFALVF